MLTLPLPSARVLAPLALAAALALAGCASKEDRAQKHYDRATEFLAKQDFSKARIEVRNALQLKPDMVAAWRSLAQIEEREQNWQVVAQSLRRITELEPTDIDSRLKLIRLVILSGAMDEALKLSNAALDVANQHPSAIALRAAILMRLNDPAGAAREAQRALELEPGNADATVVAAADRFARGDLDGALRTLDSVKADRKDDIGIVSFRLIVFEKKGDLKQVELLLRKLIELQPKEASFKTQLVRFYLAHKREDDAEKELRAIAAANPSDSRAALDVVSFLLAVKGRDAARQEIDARIKAGGRVFPFQMALVDLEISQGKIAEGMRMLEGMIQSNVAAEDATSARLKLAELHAGRRDFTATESLVSEILRADGRHIGALRLRGAMRLEQGQVDDAIADLRRALNDQPRASDIMLLLAVAFERKGSIELADKQFFDATKAANFAPAPGLNYTAFLRRRGDIGRAEDILTELASRNPADLTVLSQLAEVRVQRQNWIGAQETADAIRRIDEKSPLAAQIQGAVLAGQQKFSESLPILESIQSANPNAVQPMFALVRTYLQARQPEKAISFLQSVIAANPNSAQAHVLLGSTYMASNAPDKALQSYRTAVQVQPKESVGYRALAEFHAGRKNPDEALKIVRAGLQEQPESFALRLSLAGLLEGRGEYEAAIQEYEALYKQQPGSLVILNNLASLLSDHRTDKESLERAYNLALVLSKSPTPQFKDTLGWIYHLRGDHRSALSLLEEAAAAMPNLPYVRYHLGMTHSALGNATRAAEELEKALELVGGKGSLADKVRTQLKTLPGRS